MAKRIQKEIDDLRAELDRHNRLYYRGTPEITDLEFDRMLKRLEELEQAHPEFDSPDSPTKRVGGEPVEGFQSVEHRLPMLSIDNVYEEAALEEFDRRIRKALQVEQVEQVEYTAEYKIDGVAISLTYENGRLVRGVT
ncbi:MAG: NAD-dependent DNA ligase LigA, partial [Planctomycetaceae bacterium]